MDFNTPLYIMTEYTESVSGFKVKGKWGDVVEHGERIAFALDEVRDNSEFTDEFDEYNEWRPKTEENMSDDVKEKTAEKASLSEKEVEKESTAKDEFKEAGDNLPLSSDKIQEPDEAVTDLSQSIRYLIRALTIMATKSVRNSEEVVYENLMTAISPQYFDNELISANLDKVGDGQYVLEININNDDLKQDVSDRLSEYNEEYNRWHIGSEMDTENVESAEGVEAETQSNTDNYEPKSN